MGSFIFMKSIALQRHFAYFTKIEYQKVGKCALGFPPNRVDHESVAVVLSCPFVRLAIRGQILKSVPASGKDLDEMAKTVHIKKI